MATAAREIPIPIPAPALLQLTPEGLLPSENPRRRPVSKERFAEMVASVKAHGVLQPLVVRQAKGYPGDVYQTVIGDTRRKAAIEAARDTVPCIVRDLTDLQVLEVQLIENIQRNDMHPLDEGAAFARLMKEDPKAYTAETIAARVGKSIRWVYQRIEFTKLIPEATKAFLADEITASHAERLVRLDAKDQKNALENGCFDHYLLGPDKKRPLKSTNDLDFWISTNCRLDIDAPNVGALLPEIADAKAQAEAEGAKVLQISTAYVKLPKGVLKPSDYRKATGQEKCKKSARAVVVIGDGQGTVTDVCIDRTCEKHWPKADEPEPSSSPLSQQSKAAKRKADEWRKKQAAAKAKADQLRAVAKVAAPLIRDKILALKKMPPALVQEGLRHVLAQDFASVKKLVGEPSNHIEQALVALAFIVDADYGYESTRLELAAKVLKIDLKKLAAKAEQKADGDK